MKMEIQFVQQKKKEERNRKYKTSADMTEPSAMTWRQNAKPV